VERIPEKFLEFEIDFITYNSTVTVKLRETSQKRGEKWKTVRIVAEKRIKLRYVFGIPKSANAIKSEINKLKRKMLSRYLYNEKRLKHLEEIVYDETEGKYYIRNLATSMFIERLK
jgi:DNA-binding HxlR family transcriptional regulator